MTAPGPRFELDQSPARFSRSDADDRHLTFRRHISAAHRGANLPTALFHRQPIAPQLDGLSRRAKNQRVINLPHLLAFEMRTDFGRELGGGCGENYTRRG